MKKRENKWVGNFQTHNSLNPDEGVPLPHVLKSPAKSHTQEGTSSSSRGHSSHSQRPRKGSHTHGNGEKGDEPKAEQEQMEQESHPVPPQNKCYNPNMTAEDLVIFGKYRLSEEQEEVYRRFVEMVMGFDEFDKVCSYVHAWALGTYGHMALGTWHMTLFIEHIVHIVHTLHSHIEYSSSNT
jgi:hypothetical protein